MNKPIAGGCSTCSPDRVHLKLRRRESFSFMSTDKPVAFSPPLLHNPNAAYVLWTCQFIHEARGPRCGFVLGRVDTPPVDNNPVVGFFKRIPTTFSAHKCEGATAPLVV